MRFIQRLYQETGQNGVKVSLNAYCLAHIDDIEPEMLADMLNEMRSVLEKRLLRNALRKHTIKNEVSREIIQQVLAKWRADGDEGGVAGECAALLGGGER